MTRRRFIKLQMARGLPRNTAAEFARKVRKMGSPYGLVEGVQFERLENGKFHITCLLQPRRKKPGIWITTASHWNEPHRAFTKWWENQQDQGRDKQWLKIDPETVRRSQFHGR